MISLSYIDKLQRANADDLAFYPLTTLETALTSGHIIYCLENNEPAGYLWFGSVRAGYDVTIYQACIDYELRRHHLGQGMVAELVGLATAGGATGIRLKCASSAASNLFWQSIGFICTAVTDGGVKRKRKINHYRTNVTPGLFAVDYVEPSSKAADMRSYNKAKREGIIMPSRFSRSHY